MRAHSFSRAHIPSLPLSVLPSLVRLHPCRPRTRSYPLHPLSTSADVANTERKVDLHADPALNPDGKLILGHTSPITALFLTGDERYVVTSDRDEHIRISRYPQGEIVERFLMGHKQSVVLATGRLPACWLLTCHSCLVRVSASSPPFSSFLLRNHSSSRPAEMTRFTSGISRRRRPRVGRSSTGSPSSTSPDRSSRWPPLSGTVG